MTSTLACASSCLNDSISDGLSRLEVREVARFGLGERVESVAGCGFEFGFEVTIESGSWKVWIQSPGHFRFALFKRAVWCFQNRSKKSVAT